MIDFGSTQFRDRLQEALSRHEGFALETRWFDGSIVLEADESKCWLKVYRGRIIETLDSVPPFGSTFRLRGSRQAWEELISGERRFADLIMPGQRRFENDPSLATAERGRSVPDRHRRKPAGSDANLRGALPPRGLRVASREVAQERRSREMEPLEEITGRYVSVGGTRTFFDEIGTGTPIICVHTAGSDSREYRYLLPLLAKSGMRAIAVDLPGHSRSYPVGWRPTQTIHEHAEFVFQFGEGRLQPAPRRHRLLDRRRHHDRSRREPFRRSARRNPDGGSGVDADVPEPGRDVETVVDARLAGRDGTRRDRLARQMRSRGEGDGAPLAAPRQPTRRGGRSLRVGDSRRTRASAKCALSGASRRRRRGLLGSGRARSGDGPRASGLRARGARRRRPLSDVRGPERIADLTERFLRKKKLLAAA